MTTTHADHDAPDVGEQDAWPQVHHLLEIRAPRETVFEALATTEGLAGRWTTGAMADAAAVGANLIFTFGGPSNPRMRVVELDRPTRVGWEGAADTRRGDPPSASTSTPRATAPWFGSGTV